MIRGYEGWAYCARTPDKDIFLAYFEKGCPRSQIRGAKLNSTYRAQWFDPRTGTWQDAGGTLRSTRSASSRCPTSRGHGLGAAARLRRPGPAAEALLIQPRAGAMFLFTRNRFSGSQRVFTATSRFMFAP